MHKQVTQWTISGFLGLNSDCTLQSMQVCNHIKLPQTPDKLHCGLAVPADEVHLLQTKAMPNKEVTGNKVHLMSYMLRRTQRKAQRIPHNANTPTVCYFCSQFYDYVWVCMGVCLCVMRISKLLPSGIETLWIYEGDKSTSALAIWPDHITQHGLPAVTVHGIRHQAIPQIHRESLGTGHTGHNYHTATAFRSRFDGAKWRNGEKIAQALGSVSWAPKLLHLQTWLDSSNCGTWRSRLQSLQSATPSLSAPKPTRPKHSDPRKQVTRPFVARVSSEESLVNSILTTRSLESLGKFFQISKHNGILANMRTCWRKLSWTINCTKLWHKVARCCLALQLISINRESPSQSQRVQQKHD